MDFKNFHTSRVYAKLGVDKIVAKRAYLPHTTKSVLEPVSIFGMRLKC